MKPLYQKRISIGDSQAMSEMRNEITRMPVPAKKNIKVLIVEDRRDRSAGQNALQHKWYQEIAKQRGDMTPHDVKCELKLNLGIPILCRDDRDFSKLWIEVTTRRNEHFMSYEDKIKLMQFMDVTSLFNITQAKEYMDEIQNQYSTYQLTLPEDKP